MRAVCSALFGSYILALCMLFATRASGFGGGGSFNARDPGPRGGPANAGGPMSGLSADEIAFFFEAQEVFGEVDSVSGAVAGGEGSGLRANLNADSCASWHGQPALGR